MYFHTVQNTTLIALSWKCSIEAATFIHFHLKSCMTEPWPILIYEAWAVPMLKIRTKSGKDKGVISKTKGQKSLPTDCWWDSQIVASICNMYSHQWKRGSGLIMASRAHNKECGLFIQWCYKCMVFLCAITIFQIKLKRLLHYRWPQRQKCRAKWKLHKGKKLFHLPNFQKITFLFFFFFKKNNPTSFSGSISYLKWTSYKVKTKLTQPLLWNMICFYIQTRI